MAKEEKFLFFRVFFATALIFFINLGIFIYQYGNAKAGFTGFSVKSTIYNAYSGMPAMSKIFLIIQWTSLFLIMISVVFRDNKIRNTKKEVLEIDLKKNTGSNKTDLDTLCEVLNKKKQLKISTIAKAFKVEEDIALEWAKILESGGLVSIDYPGFGEPSVKIVEKNPAEAEEGAFELNLKNKNTKINNKRETPPDLISKKENKKEAKEIPDLISKEEYLKKHHKKESRKVRKTKKKIMKLDKKIKKIRHKINSIK